MKKIMSASMSLFCIIVMSSICFAQPSDTKKVSADLKKIAQSMIKNKELSPACTKQAKGDASKMISITPMQLGGEGAIVEGYRVDAAPIAACCMGASNCAMWVYKQNKGGNFSKVFGSDYPDELILMEEHVQNGLQSILVVYPDGNFKPGVNQLFIFDGKKYQPGQVIQREFFK